MMIMRIARGLIIMATLFSSCKYVPQETIFEGETEMSVITTTGTTVSKEHLTLVYSESYIELYTPSYELYLYNLERLDSTTLSAHDGANPYLLMFSDQDFKIVKIDIENPAQSETVIFVNPAKNSQSPIAR